MKLEALQEPRGGACTGFEVRAPGVRHRVVDGFSGSGTIVASADGRRVVFIADFAYGTLRRGRLQAYGRHKGPMVGVVFFRDGKRRAVHLLAKLLHRPRLVSTTTSHIQWLAGDRAFLASPLGKRLKLSTTSFREPVFDTETGKLLSAKDSAIWKSCHAIAYGEVKAPGVGSASYVMDPAYAVKGKLAKRLRFDAAQVKGLKGYQTVCFQRRGSALVAKRRLPMLDGVTEP